MFPGAQDLLPPEHLTAWRQGWHPRPTLCSELAKLEPGEETWEISGHAQMGASSGADCPLRGSWKSREKLARGLFLTSREGLDSLLANSSSGLLSRPHSR